MSPVHCPREPEILDAIGSGTWPAGCAEPLRQHVSTCRACADLAEAAAAIDADARALAAAARVPAAGTMWWRLSLRARLESVERADRPIAVLHWLAAACLGGAAAAIAVIAAGWTARGGDVLWPLSLTTPSEALEALSQAPAVAAQSLPFLIAAATLVIAPVIVYLASSDE
jgi:hypothetical protein